MSKRTFVRRQLSNWTSREDFGCGELWDSFQISFFSTPGRAEDDSNALQGLEGALMPSKESRPV